MKGVLQEAYAAERQRKPELAFRYKVRARIVADAAMRYLNSSGPLRLLDFGSGEGLTLLELNALLNLERGLGIEYSEGLLQWAPPLPEKVDLIQGNVMDLPEHIEDASYDIVSALALLEHLPHPEHAVTEAARVLRPGGIFVATCPSPFWDTVSTRLGLLKADQHEVEMDEERLVHAVQQAGLEVLAFQRFMWAPVGVLPYMRVPVSPGFSLEVDRLVEKLKVFSWLFVNQAVVGRKL